MVVNIESSRDYGPVVAPSPAFRKMHDTPAIDRFPFSLIANCMRLSVVDFSMASILDARNVVLVHAKKTPQEYTRVHMRLLKSLLGRCHS